MSLSRRDFLMSSVALPAFAQKKGQKKKGEPVRPNIVLLMADNVPNWVLGINGNKDLRTPNTDRLAQMGTRFRNHITGAPAPAPGRWTLLMGRTTMQGGDGNTIDKMLAGAGYSAAWAGVAEVPKLLQAQGAGKPFFLGVTLASPRPPYSGIEQKFVDLYAAARFENFVRDPAAPNATVGKEMLGDRTASLRGYAAALSAMDAEVGAVTAALYQRKLSDNTLVVFASTCGALLGRHGLWAAGDASEPPNMFEESVNTPMIWSWPGRVPAFGDRPEVVGSCDFVPTIFDFTGIAPAGNLSGRSYLLLATGKPLPKKEKWRTTTFAQLANTVMARADRYKLVERDGGKGPGELYDLVADPVEKVNQYDNPQFMTVRTGLTAELHAWQQKYSA
jgi:arylsulfatase A-like enzyme